MCGSLFLRSFPISLRIFFYRLCFIVLLKDLCGQSIAAIPRNFKRRTKTEDFSLHFVRLSTTYLLDSPFTEMITEMMN